MEATNLDGAHVGRWTVLQRNGSIGRAAAWLCVCACGQQKTLKGQDLKRQRTGSCGCAKRSRLLSTTRHGHATKGHLSRTYRSWLAMRQRCLNPRTAGFEHYGGRGIRVCAEWASFDAFLADMGERPARRSIDRIDVDGDYEPANCRWATQSEQNANRRPRASWRG